ncbi:MAG: hypothetical protein EP315_09005 [Gammaproteobacteria bacterium]|nr:MAG: hypothetical protein EP315_09005 [Gammaproteobacteria bacterium]
MLQPVKARQDTDQPRLWFNDKDHDLFIWLDDRQQVVSFQFSYNKLHNEHIIVWHRDKGFTHDRIDNGEPGDGRYKMTPILLPDGDADFVHLAQEFKHISQLIEPALAEFIYEKLSTLKD